MNYRTTRKTSVKVDNETPNSRNTQQGWWSLNCDEAVLFFVCDMVVTFPVNSLFLSAAWFLYCFLASSFSLSHEYNRPYSYEQKWHPTRGLGWAWNCVCFTCQWWHCRTWDRVRCRDSPESAWWWFESVSTECATTAKAVYGRLRFTWAGVGWCVYTLVTVIRAAWSVVDWQEDAAIEVCVSSPYSTGDHDGLPDNKVRVKVLLCTL
jgi:hypothetical protein